MIDVSSRYSIACVRRSKKPESITDAVSKTWISSYFGHPGRFLADNGLQFSNDEYNKRMCEQFNIEVSKTAAEILWSNRLCERYNDVIKESVKKVVEDVTTKTLLWQPFTARMEILTSHFCKPSITSLIMSCL